LNQFYWDNRIPRIAIPNRKLDSYFTIKTNNGERHYLEKEMLEFCQPLASSIEKFPVKLKEESRFMNLKVKIRNLYNNSKVTLKNS
jgi:hypothetical protein